jgi:uncharacterized protein YvpB
MKKIVVSSFVLATTFLISCDSQKTVTEVKEIKHVYPYEQLQSFKLFAEQMEKQRIEEEKKAELEKIEQERKRQEELAKQRELQIQAKTSEVLDIKLINQLPELPRGCEVTSLAMLLSSANINVSKMTLAEQIHKVPYMINGVYGSPYDGFVGDMYSFKTNGYGSYHGPIFNLAKQYLGDRVVDLTDQSFDVILNQIKHGKPVWIISNTHYSYLPDQYWYTWKTSNGDIKVTWSEHSVLITGFDANYIYFNDPLDGIKNRKAPKASFIAAWEQIGKQAVSYN